MTPTKDESGIYSERSILVAVLVLFLTVAVGAGSAEGSAVGALPGTSAGDAVSADTVPERTAPERVRAIRRGRRLTGWLMDGHADSIVAAMDSNYRQQVGGVDGVASLARKVGNSLGGSLTRSAHDLRSRFATGNARQVGTIGVRVSDV